MPDETTHESMTDDQADAAFDQAAQTPPPKPDEAAAQRAADAPKETPPDPKAEQPKGTSTVAPEPEPTPESDAPEPAPKAAPTSERTSPPDVETLAERKAQEAVEAEQRRVVVDAARKIAAQKPTSDTTTPPTGDISAVTNAVVEGLGDLKIGEIGTIKEFQKEYGSDITNAIVAIANQIAQKAVAPIADTVQARQQEEIHAAFLSDMERMGHSDIRDIERNMEFWKYVDERSESVRKAIESGDPEITDLVIQGFKQKAGIAKAPAADSPERDKLAEQQRTAKAQKDALHGSTTRSREQVPPRARDGRFADEKTISDEEAEDEFNRATKQARDVSA